MFNMGIFKQAWMKNSEARGVKFSLGFLTELGYSYL
jgi:hypothetical protein